MLAFLACVHTPKDLSNEAMGMPSHALWNFIPILVLMFECSRNWSGGCDAAGCRWCRAISRGHQGGCSCLT